MSTAVAKRGAPTLKTLLEQARPSIAAVLPRHLNADRLIKVALVSCTKTPKLLECDPLTIVQSVMQAAQLGLEINSVLGSAYLVPFFNNQKKQMEAQLMPGYRGLIDLARRSGAVSNIEARIVYEGDRFDVKYGTDPQIVHVPRLDGERTDDKMVAVYTVAWLTGTPRPSFEVMTRDEVEKVRAVSRTKDSADGPWSKWAPDMWRKTAVKKHAKFLPLTTELATAIELDTRAETGEVGSVTDFDTPDEVLSAVAAKTAERAAELKAQLQGSAKLQDKVMADEKLDADDAS